MIAATSDFDHRIDPRQVLPLASRCQKYQLLFPGPRRDQVYGHIISNILTCQSHILYMEVTLQYVYPYY